MTVKPEPRLLNTAELKLLNTQPFVTQNGANQLYFNPRAMADFDSTVVTPTLYVGFEKLSEREYILHHIESPVPGAVRLRRSKTKRTGTCSFGPVLADCPILRCFKGRQNHYPYRIDDLEDGIQRFVILVGKPKVMPVVDRTKGGAGARKKKAARAARASHPK